VFVTAAMRLFLVLRRTEDRERLLT